MNEEEFDNIIIRKLVEYEQIDFNDLSWFNCYLHNANVQDFKNRRTYDDAIKNDNEICLIFIIVYSFEREGFDSKLDKCIRECELYREGGKIKTHPLSVLMALTKIKREYKVDDAKQLLGCEEIEKLADKWFEKSKEIHNEEFNKGFNERGFNSKHLISFLKFFSDRNINILRELVGRSKFDDAFNLLTTTTTKIKGIGPKVAKFIIRDLAFSLTVWGKNERVSLKDAKVLSYTLPIDIWVRRCAISIPSIEKKVISSLERGALADDNIVDKVDEKISMVIAERCCNMELNPLRFNLGAYLFGVNEIKRKMSVDKIYNKLKDVLLKKDFT